MTAIMNDKYISEEEFIEFDQELMDWPVEFIRWNIDNSKRYDVRYSFESSGGLNPPVYDTIQGLLRRGERSGNDKWNGN